MFSQCNFGSKWEIIFLEMCWNNSVTAKQKKVTCYTVYNSNCFTERVKGRRIESGLQRFQFMCSKLVPGLWEFSEDLLFCEHSCIFIQTNTKGLQNKGEMLVINIIRKPTKSKPEWHVIAYVTGRQISRCEERKGRLVEEEKIITLRTSRKLSWKLKEIT
jgi:hypothetical protein